MMSKEERGDHLKREESRRRTQWYEDQFAYKPNHISQPIEKIMKEALVIAELRTNVIVCKLQTCVRDVFTDSE